MLGDKVDIVSRIFQGFMPHEATQIRKHTCNVEPFIQPLSDYPGRKIMAEIIYAGMVVNFQ